MDIRFADHPSFHRAAAGMVGGALLFGAALHPVTTLAPLAGGVLGVAAGAVVAHGKSGRRMVAAGAALVPLFVMAPSWPMLAAVAAIVSLALAVGGPRGLGGLAGVLLGAVTTLVAMWCALRIGNAQATAHWPPLVTAMTAAAAMGLVGALAMLPRHLRVALDPVRGALRRLPVSLDSEVRGLCARAAAIWTTARVRISDDAGKALVRDGVLKTLEVAAKIAQVKVTGPSEAELAERIADLDQRITAATDGEVKAQYQAARAALGDQEHHRDRIRQGRERLVARMHNHVAALEKFSLQGSHPERPAALRPAVASRRRARDPLGERSEGFALAATGVSAPGSARAGSAAAKQLEELFHEVAVSGEALVEIEIGEAPPAIATPAAPRSAGAV